MSVSPAPRHAHTSLAVPNSALRSRIPKPASPSRPQRSPSRAASATGGPDHSLGVQFLRPHSTSPRPAPLTHAEPPVRDRQSLVASEDSFGQTVFLNRVPPRTSSLSRPPTRLEVPSSPDDPLFYHPPPLTYPLAHSRSATHQRESIITQSSNITASSIYPPSSSSQTGPDSPPSPSTPSAHSSIDPVQTPGFAVDADDVSYRLRLLVRNNYFLPPAHSKPNHSELSLLSVNTNLPPSKTPSPTFRDLFRVGRPRTPSKAPESPKVVKAPAVPSPVVRPPLPMRMATSPAPLSTAPSLREKERRGRVLVIRERLDDLITAANAAELDMRAREDDRRRREPPHAGPNSAVAAPDLIDPTETVDLPAYLFPVQSSLAPFGGLGVDNSIGAAALADALPPRAEDTEDEAWRKALLHKAVGLSMLSIPEPTPPPSQRTASISANSALASPASRSIPGSGSGSGLASKPASAHTSPVLPSPANIGRAIVPGSRLSTLPRMTTSLRSPGFATRELPTSAGSSGSPASKASPSLPPPPRPRTASKPSLSPSPAGVEGVKPSMLPIPKHTVRRALSTPMLAQKVGTAAANANKDIAPPLPSPLSARARPRQSEGLVGGSRVPTPSKKLKPRATTPSLPRPTTPLSRAPTPSKLCAPPSLLQRPVTPSRQHHATPSRAPTPSPALLLETPEGQTVLPTRDTLTSLTSGSNYSDDDEIVAVDDDDDEIVAVDVEEEEEPREEERADNREREEDEEIPEGEGLYEDDMRAPSRGGIMLRPDSRMTNATIVRPSFTEGRTFSRASNAMSAFGGLRDSDALDRARSMSPPTAPPSQRSSIAQPHRSSTLVTDMIPSTPSEASFSSTTQNQNRSPPLNVRRSQIIVPLTLQPPPSIASTVAALRSAPPPASTDFFDAVYTHSLAHGGLGFDSDSEEADPPVPIFVQPRSRAVSTSASTSRSRPILTGRSTIGGASGVSTVMHFSSITNPYLATDPNPYQSLDPRKPVTNTPPATQTRFRGLGQMLRPATSMGLRSTGRKSPHLIQHPAVRAAASNSNAGSFHGHDGSSHGHESIRSGAASIRSQRSLGARAARSEESVTSAQRQDPSLSRLDGMYAKHVQAEKDRLKQISAASRRT